MTTTPEVINPSTFKTPFVSGLLEGYQTFDAIGAVVIGGVLVISMNFKKGTSFEIKKEIITKAGIVAGIGLLIIYTGLIYNGVLFSSTFGEEATRTEILGSLSTQTLGNIGTTFLSVLVALACFTTGVGIITGTADYFKGLFKDSQKAYIITAIVGCLVGVLVGQMDFHSIIVIALPVLMFIYPITIVLILLNIAPDKYASKVVFRAVVLVTFIFSIPDFLGFIIPRENLVGIKNIIPLANSSLGWVIPAFITFLVLNLKRFR